MSKKNKTKEKLNQEIEKLFHDLRERNKELSFLYEVSKLSTRVDLSLEELLQKSVELIPSAWHYSDITCARIVVENKQYETRKFKKTKWSQSEDIKVAGKKLGSVEVCLLEKKPELDNGPFLKEERNLITTFSSLLSSIIERKKAEAALRVKESCFRDIFETADIGIAYSSLGGKVIEVNKALEEITGIPSQEITGKNLITLTRKFLSLKNAKQILPIMIDILKGRKIRPFEINFKDKVLEVSSTYNPESKRITGLLKDITDSKNAEKKIKKSLKEKEVLLKEIHHRVKNNMQVISSLINIQARRIKDPKAQEMFKDTRNRVMSMAIVHERLYRSEDLTGIDFSKYIERMAVHLMSYYGELSQNIELKKEIENIFLDITKAVPLGLITNELLANALKHAFPKNKKGEIKIKFNKKGKTYHLTISDNGIGFPKDLDFRKADSMGMDLVNSLVSQINGKVDLLRDKGTAFKITFKD
ncbi:MAG: histidine kinase dimerization/phosphoacceptor domain -containing protein [Candidatus Aminicenantes bacterium]